MWHLKRQHIPLLEQIITKNKQKSHFIIKAAAAYGTGRHMTESALFDCKCLCAKSFFIYIIICNNFYCIVL